MTRDEIIDKVIYLENINGEYACQQIESEEAVADWILNNLEGRFSENDIMKELNNFQFKDDWNNDKKRLAKSISQLKAEIRIKDEKI